MPRIRFSGKAAVFFVIALALPYMVTGEQQQYTIQDYHIYEPGPVRQSRLYLDGSTVELETGIKIYPVTGSALPQMTPAEWQEMARHQREEFEMNPNKIVIGDDRGRQGMDIVFNCTSVPPEALAALESVATYIEHLFTDSVTVSINISFAPLGPGILGQAQSFVAGNPSWDVTRASLVADMDGDDSIQTWLPAGNTIPIRYNYGTSTITNEDRVYFVVAPYNAAIGYFPSLAAQITFSSNFTWDYDPSNGVNGMCFNSVAAHEIGHVLGFISNADGYGADIDILDIYRFQRTDGAGNYNPDSWAEFQTTPRTVDASPGLDDANSDMIEVEFQMSDGNPYQASHFSQNNVDAIMQPAQGSGETFYPNYYRYADRVMFDAIGWDYELMYYLTTNTIGLGSVDRNPDTTWYAPGATVELTAVPDSGWMFSQWGGALIGNNNPDTVIMDGDIIVTAAFLTEFVTLTLNINGNGSVNITPNLPQYPRGTPVELFAIADPGWSFSHWGGNLWGNQNPDTLVMDANKTVYANFIETGVEEGKAGLMASNYLNISPNPTTGMANIRYQITDNSNALLEIYDVSGTLVRSFDLESSIMDHESVIAWSGEDNTGRKLPGGVYFIKFRAGDYQTTNKLLLIR
jgi:hypothetical protein